MKIQELNIIAQGIDKLLESKLETRLAFKLIKFRDKINNELQFVIDTLNLVREQYKDTDPDTLLSELRAEEDKLLNQEIEFELIKINLSELPDEIEGYVLQALSKIIFEEDKNNEL